MIAATEMDYQLWHVAVVPYQTAVVYGLRRRLVIADDDGSCARHVASLPWQPYEKREIYTHADPAYDPAADPGTSRQLSLLSCAGRETSTGQRGDALVDLGFFGGGDFGSPSKRSERALRGSGLTGEWNLSVCELGRGHD